MNIRGFHSLMLLLALLGVSPAHAEKPSMGGGTLRDPAIGPEPAFNLGAGRGYLLVKNWDFGTGGTIPNTDVLSEEFQYHDQFNTFGNGDHYGAKTVAPVKDLALYGQPVEDPARPVREFFGDSMKSYLIPLDASESMITPTKHNIGCGSFHARFRLPAGGARLGQELLWETRVRYKTPPYFWFALWTSGNKWNHGAEMDVVESFGYDNGNGYTNFYGCQWHSDSVGGDQTYDYGNWSKQMKERGIEGFDAEQWHVWSWIYRTDDTYSVYLDGREVQKGTLHWTLEGKSDGESLDMNFIFDGAWGHTAVQSVNHSLPAEDFEGTFYEWDYSRIYLSGLKE